MLIEIEKIQVKDRIRQSFGDIEELANDIKENGLINPPVVTPEYELIAGERRLKALQMLEYKQIEVRVMPIKDAEHQLKLEISENEERKDFSRKERLEYARRLERIESIKAEQREKSGVKIPMENFPKGTTRDIVAEKAGIGSGKQYEKEKYIADNADPETLAKWDVGDISTHAAYIKIKQENEELENKIKGYQMKLDKAGSNSAQVAMQAAQAQALSDLEAQLKEKELEIESLKSQEPKTVEVVPTDYHKNKDERKRLEEKVQVLQESLISERKKVQELTPRKTDLPEYNYDYFNQTSDTYLQYINIYAYKEIEFSELSAFEVHQYMDTIKKVKNYLDKIKAQFHINSQNTVRENFPTQEQENNTDCLRGANRENEETAITEIDPPEELEKMFQGNTLEKPLSTLYLINSDIPRSNFYKSLEQDLGLCDNGKLLISYENYKIFMVEYDPDKHARTKARIAKIKKQMESA